MRFDAGRGSFAAGVVAGNDTAFRFCTRRGSYGHAACNVSPTPIKRGSGKPWAILLSVRRTRPLLFLMETTLHLLELVNQRLHRSPVRTEAQAAGLAGEQAAYFFLRREGFTVVARRWRHSMLRGEVDLIAWEGDTLAFIEVKTRSASSTVAAEFRIDHAKGAAMRRMADAYVRQLPWRGQQPTDLRVRFDAVSVYLQNKGRPDIRLQRGYL